MAAAGSVAALSAPVVRVASFGSSQTSFARGASIQQNVVHAPVLRAAGGPVKVVGMKQIQGTCTNISNDKTAAIEVKRLAVHPKYKKRIILSKKYQVHDPDNRCTVGDWVTIVKCAPVSKSKRFQVSAIRAAKVAGKAMEATQEVLPPLQSQQEA